MSSVCAAQPSVQSDAGDYKRQASQPSRNAVDVGGVLSEHEPEVFGKLFGLYVCSQTMTKASPVGRSSCALGFIARNKRAQWGGVSRVLWPFLGAVGGEYIINVTCTSRTCLGQSPNGPGFRGPGDRNTVVQPEPTCARPDGPGVSGSPFPHANRKCWAGSGPDPRSNTCSDF